jgi:hypothetical protein
MVLFSIIFLFVFLFGWIATRYIDLRISLAVIVGSSDVLKLVSITGSKNRVIQWNNGSSSLSHSIRFALRDIECDKTHSPVLSMTSGTLDAGPDLLKFFASLFFSIGNWLI